MTVLVALIIVLFALYALFSQKQRKSELDWMKFRLVTLAKDIGKEPPEFAIHTSQEWSKTVNKRDIYICTSGNKNKDTLTEVGIHEMAHVLTSKADNKHDGEWMSIYRSLIAKARKRGWYDPEKREAGTHCAV